MSYRQVIRPLIKLQTLLNPFTYSTKDIKKFIIFLSMKLLTSPSPKKKKVYISILDRQSINWIVLVKIMNPLDSSYGYSDVICIIQNFSSVIIKILLILNFRRTVIQTFKHKLIIYHISYPGSSDDMW